MQHVAEQGGKWQNRGQMAKQEGLNPTLSHIHMVPIFLSSHQARSRTGWQVAEQGANGKIGGLEPNPESYTYGPNIPFITSSTQQNRVASGRTGGKWQNRRASGRSGIKGGQVAYVARSRTGASGRTGQMAKQEGKWHNRRTSSVCSTWQNGGGQQKYSSPDIYSSIVPGNWLYRASFLKYQI